MVQEKETSVPDLLDKCEKAKGIGAVLINVDNGSSGQIYPESSLIPAVAVPHKYGRALVELIDQVVTIGDAGDDHVEYTYATLSGTSMAAPHVSAAAALVWSHFPGCSNHHIRYALAQTAQHPMGEPCDENYGYGVVKAKDAYDWLRHEEDFCTQDIPQISQGGCTTI
jgi:subtilisin family serine protease